MCAAGGDRGVLLPSTSHSPFHQRHDSEPGAGVPRDWPALIIAVHFIANNSVCVTATKALIEKWIALSVHFVQEQKFQSLGARVDVLLKSRGVEKTAAGRGRWR